MSPTRCFAVLAFLTLAACSEKKDDENKDSQPALKSSAHHPTHAASGAASGSPASATGTPANTGSPSATAATTGSPATTGAGGWEGSIPAKPVTAKAGDRVWALAPNASGGTAVFDVVEVDSVQGNNATTLGLMKGDGGKWTKDSSAKHAMTPGGAMVPAPGIKDAKVKQGEIVIASIPGYHTTAAHVVKLKDDGAEVKYAHGDKVKDETIGYAMPLAKGIAPFAYVAAKKGASYEEILVGAVTADTVYGVDESGNVVKAAKSDVKPLEVEWKDRKKGDKVTVLTEGAATETTIDVVSVSKWVYTVKINGAEKRVPFYAVVDKL